MNSGDAHHIIRNALAVMTAEQQIAWCEVNARDGIDGEGATRAAERQAVVGQIETFDRAA